MHARTKTFLENFIKLAGEVTELHGRRELSKNGHELMRSMLREAMDGLGTANKVHGPDPVKVALAAAKVGVRGQELARQFEEQLAKQNARYQEQAGQMQYGGGEMWEGMRQSDVLYALSRNAVEGQLGSAEYRFDNGKLQYAYDKKWNASMVAPWAVRDAVERLKKPK